MDRERLSAVKVSFQLDERSLEILDAEAQAAGEIRSEWIRRKLFPHPTNAWTSCPLSPLLRKEIIEVTWPIIHSIKPT
jgi:hypothetical protein